MEQVESYAKRFFEQMQTLNDYEKICKNMEKAERMIEFKSKAPKLISDKVNAYESPTDEMQIYATQKSKYFSKESDIILLCLTHKHGYGNWSDIKKSIKRDSRCRFDHLFLSRNEVEIQRRVDILVKAIEKESQMSEQKKQKLIHEEKKEFAYGKIESDDEVMEPVVRERIREFVDVRYKGKKSMPFFKVDAYSLG